MQQDLESVCQQISDAYRPEDLFGVEEVLLPPETMCEFLERRYRTFKASLDSGVEELEFRELVLEALEKLERLREEARQKVGRFHYGMMGFDLPPPTVKKAFSVAHNRYLLGPRLDGSEHTDRFQGFLERDGEYLGTVEIHLAASVSGNPFMLREARAIDLLHQATVPQWKHLPCLLDRFDADHRIGLVFRATYGLSLSEVRSRRAQLQGVDQKHIAWMLDRTLSALGYVHRCGLVHGALSPDAIVINDRLHNATLTKWGYSAYNPARSGEQVLRSNAPHSPFLAPEIIAGQEIGPWSDIYALGKTMIWCIGGNPDSGEIPPGVEPEVAGFLRRMVQEDYHRRSDDCWELYEEQCRIKDALWPRKFLHLDVS